MIDAINAYLQHLSQVNFDGSLKMSDLEATIRNVTGVNDVVLTTVAGRADADSPPTYNNNTGNITPSGQYYIQNSRLVNRLFHPAAGYIISETTAHCQLAQTLNFIAQ